jgi:GNAT superfamily N-acetyltransferase
VRAAAVSGALGVRRFRDEDEPRVLELLQTALGAGPIGARTPELFAWKHREGPFGPSLMLVAEQGERIVGFRAFLRWRFRAGGRTLEAVRAVDTATHPDHWGKGVFSRLTSTALDSLRGEADLVFNTPNSRSLPGYLKLGWQVAGTVPVRVRPARPWPRARRPAVEAESAAAALADGAAVAALLDEASELDERLATPRDPAYLRWRYTGLPPLDYRALRESAGGRLRGLALFRVRRRGRLRDAALAELIVAPDGRATARRLLRRLGRAAAVDHITCCLPPGGTADRAARRRGFLRVPRGPTLAVKPLGDFSPAPTELRSWALSLGDLEVL